MWNSPSDRDYEDENQGYDKKKRGLDEVEESYIEKQERRRRAVIDALTPPDIKEENNG